MDHYERILWISVYANVLGIHHHPRNQQAPYDFHDRARNAANRAVQEYRCQSSQASAQPRSLEGSLETP